MKKITSALTHLAAAVAGFFGGVLSRDLWKLLVLGSMINLPLYAGYRWAMENVRLMERKLDHQQKMEDREQDFKFKMLEKGVALPLESQKSDSSSNVGVSQH